MQRETGVILATLFGAALAACAPAFAQPERGSLRPPPPYEREYQSFCRDRPAACAGGYGQGQHEFLIRRQDDAMDAVRRREEEVIIQRQQLQQPRR